MFKSYEDASEYVDHADEMESEMKAEYGMGAVSLGYNGSDAVAMFYDGYRAGDDPTYSAAVKLLRDRYEVVKVITPEDRALTRWNAKYADSTIPF
jgi:hypothetical protein